MGRANLEVNPVARRVLYWRAIGRVLWCARPTEEIEMTGTDSVWLTDAAYQRLREELVELRAAERDPGDDGQAEATRRARRLELEDLLDRAIVGEAPADDGVAEPGMVLTVRFDDDEETETFLLGRRDGADTEELEVYSPESPLGSALTGARRGQVRSYQVPSGATVNVTLLEAVPYGMHVPSH